MVCFKGMSNFGWKPHNCLMCSSKSQAALGNPTEFLSFLPPAPNAGAGSKGSVLSVAKSIFTHSLGYSLCQEGMLPAGIFCIFFGFNTEMSLVPDPSSAIASWSNCTQKKLRCSEYGSMRTTTPSNQPSLFQNLESRKTFTLSPICMDSLIRAFTSRAVRWESPGSPRNRPG